MASRTARHILANMSTCHNTRRYYLITYLTLSDVQLLQLSSVSVYLETQCYKDTRYPDFSFFFSELHGQEKSQNNFPF